jgi:Fe2+ transport system protein B
MVKFDSSAKKKLIELYDTRKISLEGNILKVIDADGDKEFAEYIKDCSDRDKETRRKRLEMTKQIQQQNRDLTESKESLESYQEELRHSLAKMQEAMTETQQAKEEAEALRLEAESSREAADLARIEAECAREEAENAKKQVESDLDVLQRKTQNELIGTIVKVALYVIVGVGLTTTVMYAVALSTNHDTQIIGSTWSNMFGILLTNAFSIVGTIMGVKYATKDN